MSFLINPFVFAAAGGDFESLATVTVGSGGASEIEFTSIPGTYQHLQVRIVARNAGAANSGLELAMRFNGSSATDYTTHQLYGDGSNAAAEVVSAIVSQDRNFPAWIPQNGTTADVFAGSVIDILDYGSSSKNTTWRSLSGWDANGSGFVLLRSGLWKSTSSISSIKLYMTSNFQQHSTAALYGITA